MSVIIAFLGILIATYLVVICIGSAVLFVLSQRSFSKNVLNTQLTFKQCLKATASVGIIGAITIGIWVTFIASYFYELRDSFIPNIALVVIMTLWLRKFSKVPTILSLIVCLVMVVIGAVVIDESITFIFQGYSLSPT